MMLGVPATIAAVFICMGSAAFFAGLETGLISANQFALYSARERGVLYARAADFLLLRPERLLSTTLIGTNVSVVTATVLLSSLLRTSGVSWAPWAGSTVLVVVWLLAAEIIPKSFFRQHANTIAVRLAPILVAFYFIFSPIALILNSVVKALLFVTGQLRSTKEGIGTRQSLRLLVRLGSREAGLSMTDQRIIDDIFDFQDTIAREVMIQIHRTLACPRAMQIGEIARRAIAAQARFVPVYENRLDNIVGYIDIEEIATSTDLSVDALLHPPKFYPDTKRIPELLLELNHDRLAVAFLANEYGRISGMVTPDEIVGEVLGRFSVARRHHSPDIERSAAGGYRVVGVADIEDFRNETGMALPRGPYDTVGGFVQTRLGRIPEAGDTLEFQGATFTVVDRDDLHIKQLDVTVPKHHDPR
ncbi:MAG: HlyC/CorC family transporter [Spirochaetaceae bacterium]|nr:MAG: HlyC/CorC family transporter [Spirochaetaceae bacterium]